jgi:hypothetical protein
MLDPNSPFYQSKSQRGPVLTGVLDTVTGQIFYAQNSQDLPEDLVPEMQSRLTEYLASLGGQRIPFKGEPGTHSEIHALNAALLVRPGAPMSDFLLYNVRLKGADKGQPILQCANCQPLTEGVTYVP